MKIKPTLLVGLLLAWGSCQAASPLGLDSAVQCKPPVSNASLERRLDSLSNEFSLLVKVLEAKGVNLAYERMKLARKDSVYSIKLDTLSMLGPVKAKHTLSVFIDLQCPYCMRVVPRLKAMIAKNPDLNVGFHHFPLSFHDRAMPAAKALWAAGRQGKFTDYYYGLHSDTTAKSLSDSVLTNVAKGVGLDLVKFAKDRESKEAQAAIRKDMELAEKVGVEGTPSLFLDGKSTQDPERQLAQFKQ